jgi:hypothetical protein
VLGYLKRFHDRHGERMTNTIKPGVEQKTVKRADSQCSGWILVHNGSKEGKELLAC